MTTTAEAPARHHSYDFWNNALRGVKQPIHEGEAHPGRWYMRQKDGSRLPVATWADETGELLAMVGVDGRAKMRDPVEIWTYICQHPIDEATYDVVFETGTWPDDPPVIEAEAEANAYPDDPHTKAKAYLAGAKHTAEEYLSTPVSDDKKADLVAVLSRRIGEAGKRADEVRKIEKQPHLDAGREVDEKWRDIIEDAKTLVAKLKKHVEPFLLAKRREEEARQRAEREKADELRRQAAAANDPDSRRELTEQAREADRESEARNPSAGRTGSKVALRTEKVAVIKDIELVLIAFKDNEEVVVLAQKLANRAVRAGTHVPGVEVVTEQKAA